MTHERPPQGPLPGPAYRHPPKRPTRPRIALLRLFCRAAQESCTRTRRPVVAHNYSPRAAAALSVSRSHPRAAAHPRAGSPRAGRLEEALSRARAPAVRVRVPTDRDRAPAAAHPQGRAPTLRARVRVPDRVRRLKSGQRPNQIRRRHLRPSQTRLRHRNPRGWTCRASARWCRRVSTARGATPRPLSGISVASSSGYQSLDTAARRAVSAAGPYRPFPKHMSSSIRVTATVIFRLN